MNNEKKYLLGLTLAELKQVAKDLGMPAFTGGQMAKWLYEQHVKSIDEMTNISKANRAKLAAEYEIGCFGYSDAQHSVDGTIKYLFPTRSGKFVAHSSKVIPSWIPANSPSHGKLLPHHYITR